MKLCADLKYVSDHPRLGSRRTLVSLGRLIVILYVITFLTAVVSVRVHSEATFSDSEDPAMDLYVPPASITGE